MEERYKQLRDSGKSAVDPWSELHQEWVTKHSEQSWKSASGSAFERIVLAEIENQISEMEKQNRQKSGGGYPRIKVCRWNQVPKILREGILSDQVWDSTSPETYFTVESKVDLVLIAHDPNDENVVKCILAVYSCKTSAAERFQQDLYWIERFRARKIRFCFVTLDKRFIKYAKSTKRSPTKAQSNNGGRLCESTFGMAPRSVRRFSRFDSA